MKNKSHNLLLSRTFQYLGIMLIVVAMGGGYWYWKQARAAQTVTDNRPSFEAPLTTGLDLAAGQGIATYSRADGADRRATVTDFEGRIIPVKQNEARFEGARRVENLFSYSNDFSNAAWTVQLGATKIGTNQMSLTSTSGSGFYQQMAAVIPDNNGRTFRYSIDVQWVSGDTSYIMGGYSDVGFSVSPNATIAVSSEWKRFSILATTHASTDATNLSFNLIRGANGGVINVRNAQLEEVTGQTNQNPSEYVSTNVLPAFPYHGAGVDRVKYFDTENGNTVASNVVTEAAGAALPTTAIRGYLAEGARTNLLTYSDMASTTGWTGSNSSLLTVNNPGSVPRGAVSCLRNEVASGQANGLTVKSGLSLSLGTQYTFSVWAYIPSSVPAGKAMLSAWYDNSGWNSISSTLITERDQWVLKTHTFTSNATYASHIVGVGLSNGSSPGMQSYSCFAQLEQAAFASSYIPTTTASVTRAVDSLSYPLTSNVNDSEGSIAIDATTNWSGGAGWDAFFYDSSLAKQRFALWHWNGSNNGLTVDRHGNGGVRNNYDTGSPSITQGVTMKLGQRWNDSAHSLFRDGALRGSDTSLSLPYDVISSGNLFIGRSYSGGSQYAFASIKNVRVWKKALSDTELQNMTSTTEGIATSAVKKTTITDAPDNTGLVGYWSFEDGSGTKAEDFSPTGTNTGTLTNGPTWVDGKIGKALNFDGTNDYVGVGISEIGPNIGSVNAITLSSWVKPTVYPGALGRKRAISFLLSDGTTGGLLGFYDGGKIEVGGRSTGGDGFQSATVTFPALDEWHLATGVLDFQDDKIYVYLDGVLSATQSVSFANTTYTHGTPTLIDSLGSFSNSSDFFSGSLDEVRIYDYALSASEIAGLYAQGSTGKTTVNASENNELTDGLVGLWSFNGPDLSGTTAYDRSGQGNNGTLTNGPTVYPGKVGQGLKFDGVNDFVAFGTNLSSLVTTELTVSAWVRPTLVPDGIGRVVATTYDWDAVSANVRGWSLGNNYGSEAKISFIMYDSSGASASASDTSFFTDHLTEWTHVVGVFKGGQYLRLYVNDSMIEEDSTSVPANIGYSAINLSIGARADNSTQGDWHGQIDEIRVYDRALSAEEVSALYNSGK